MYCHSARSESEIENFEPSSSMNVYVGSGGRKASLSAILDGQGGQQNRQHNSLKLNPFIVSARKGVFFFSPHTHTLTRAQTHQEANTKKKKTPLSYLSRFLVGSLHQRYRRLDRVRGLAHWSRKNGHLRLLYLMTQRQRHLLSISYERSLTMIQP